VDGGSGVPSPFAIFSFFHTSTAFCRHGLTNSAHEIPIGEGALRPPLGFGTGSPPSSPQ
jgi:hypothetical protein